METTHMQPDEGLAWTQAGPLYGCELPKEEDTDTMSEMTAWMATKVCRGPLGRFDAPSQCSNPSYCSLTRPDTNLAYRCPPSIANSEAEKRSRDTAISRVKREITASMRVLARQGSIQLTTPFIIASVCLSVILFTSLFQHEAVSDISQSVAQRARDSYLGVKQKIRISSSTESNVLDGAYLEPEWQFAKHVSIVYTWINGSDPVHRALKVQHTKFIDAERDRDNDDLRHSFRALNEFLPWHEGTIYLVTPRGQTPNWLDKDNQRLKVINQDDLIEESERPTFNSNCIESVLHKIPGITEKFIVVNDDYFFGRLVHPSDFFTKPHPITGEYGVKLFLEPWSYGVAENWKGEDQWPKSVRYTAKVISDAYEEIFMERTRITAHAPFVYDKRAFEGIHHRFNVHLRRNCRHKIRDAEDAIPPFLHHQYIIQEGSRCCGIRYETVTGKSRFFEWNLDLDRNEREFNKIIKQVKPVFFNINDKMGTGATNQDKIKKAQEQLKELMEDWLPTPSEFESL